MNDSREEEAKDAKATGTKLAVPPANKEHAAWAERVAKSCDDPRYPVGRTKDR